MNRVALAFFTVAPIYGLAGMAWGMQMGSSGDHSMMPAHAHLNLLGLVLNGVMGAFYGLAGPRASGKLAWANFALSNAGVVIMIPTLAMLLGGNESVVPIMAVSEVLTVLGGLAFLISVASLWRKKNVEAAV